MPTPTQFPSNFKLPRFPQTGFAEGRENLLAADFLTRNYVTNLIRTRQAVLANEDRSDLSFGENDLAFAYRQLVDPVGVNSQGVPGNIITRAIMSQRAGTFSGANASQHGTVTTVVANVGSFLSNGMGARATATASHASVDSGRTTGLAVIAAFRIDPADLVSAFEVTARSGAADVESYRASYIPGGAFQTISRTGSADTVDVASAISNANLKDKGADLVIGMRLDSAAGGSVYFNGQRAAITLIAAAQAFAGTHAGVRMNWLPATSRNFLRYFEVVRLT